MFLQDLRYAIRTLTRSAGLSLVIVASLAIGIGANTATFSVVNALLLKPLPYPDPLRVGRCSPEGLRYEYTAWQLRNEALVAQAFRPASDR